jgi:hypothetical protein
MLSEVCVPVVKVLVTFRIEYKHYLMNNKAKYTVYH